jgi:hypothetical protein
MEEVPVFLKTTVWGALVVPTSTLPKAADVGVTVVCAAAKVENRRLQIAIRENRTMLWNCPANFVTRLDIELSS